MDILLIVAGALTGFLVGLVGVGGGSLMTPILLLLFGVSPTSAVGTDLWFAAITKLFATRVHHGHNLIDWQVARRLWAGSITAAVATVFWLHHHPMGDNSLQFLKITIAIAVIVTSVSMLFQKPLQDIGRKFRTTDEHHFKVLQAPLTVLAGAILGVLISLTSVGAGTIGAVFLVYLYPLRMTSAKLVATDIVHAIPLAMVAGFGHLIIGNVNYVLLGNLLLGSIPAVLLGAMLSARMPHKLLKNLLAIVLIIIGYQLWVSAGGKH